MKTQTVAIAGNCQVAPLALILSRLFDIRISTTIPVHLTSDLEESKYIDKLQSADCVICHQVNDLYPCKFVRTSSLRKLVDDRLLTIPNLFYRGFTPDLRYLRFHDDQLVPGPLGDYHSAIIFDAWKDGHPNDIIQNIYEDEKNG